jgi:hypothetical protein
VQAFNDSAVFLTVTLATLFAGRLVDGLGWERVNLLAAVPVVLLMAAIAVGGGGAACWRPPGDLPYPARLPFQMPRPAMTAHTLAARCAPCCSTWTAPCSIPSPICPKPVTG